MADGVNTEVRGLANFKRTASAAERDLRDTAEADRAAAAALAAAARIRAPKVSHRLANSVRPVPVPGGAGVEVGTEYGGVIHYGWAARNIRANPFAADAIEPTQPVVVAAYHRNIDHTLSKVKGI
jgi:hypothetical protein